MFLKYFSIALLSAVEIQICYANPLELTFRNSKGNRIFKYFNLSIKTIKKLAPKEASFLSFVLIFFTNQT
ncbi:hypothetical protein KAOT1_17233 [Kordia algicida OT-1]|uniref:Uncharacterized protein n=1 Tax=Kordia algicida OT-1 TaxID=391587 RepID=A9DSF6_9FLAO|nr:hypothetical protein KAOT1_17233 [Kordia algicida OT-1]